MTAANDDHLSLSHKDLEAINNEGDFKYIEHKWKVFEARQDYAWNYFDFHAKQRTTMFNFFLLFTGLLVNAYVTTFRGDITLASGLAAIGVLVTWIFVCLERRNEELVHVAEDVLESLEEDVLFGDYKRNVLWPRRRGWLGVMEQQKDRKLTSLGIFLRQSKDEQQLGSSRYSHGKWLPLFQYIIIALFLFLTIFPWIASKSELFL